MCPLHIECYVYLVCWVLCVPVHQVDVPFICDKKFIFFIIKNNYLDLYFSAYRKQKPNQITYRNRKPNRNPNPNRTEPSYIPSCAHLFKNFWLHHWPQAWVYTYCLLVSYTCQTTKGRKQNTSLYTSLPVPHSPWQDLNLNFELGLPKTMRIHNPIFVVVDLY